MLDGAAEAWWRLPPRARMFASLLLGLLVIAGVAHRGGASPWGDTTQVVVATADGTAGQAPTVVVADRPADLVPADALAAPPDGVLVRDITTGEVLTQRHVGRDLTAMLADGEVAFALDQPLPDMPARAPLQVLGLGLDGSGQRLGRGRLLAVEDGWSWIAVDEADAPAVAAALHGGGVQVVVAPHTG